MVSCPSTTADGPRAPRLDARPASSAPAGAPSLDAAAAVGVDMAAAEMAPKSGSEDLDARVRRRDQTRSLDVPGAKMGWPTWSALAVDASRASPMDAPAEDTGWGRPDCTVDDGVVYSTAAMGTTPRRATRPPTSTPLAKPSSTATTPWR